MSATPLVIALGYIDRGWSPIPIPLGTKKPVEPGWQKLRLDAASAPRYFNGAAMNIGVLMGPASLGLADVDLDCAEAVSVAPAFLPRTNAIFGRAGRRFSHWLYQTDLSDTESVATIEFLDPCAGADQKAMLVELRIGGGGAGAQTIFPGSVHVSGEHIAWEGPAGDPAVVEGADLRRRVGWIAAAALLGRYWPAGNRHKAALALGGALAHGGWDAPHAKLFVEAVAKAAGDEEWRDRVRAAADSVAAYAVGKKVSGFPTLSERFPERAVAKAGKWLGLLETDGFGFTRRSGSFASRSPPTADAASLAIAASLDDFVAYLPQHNYIFKPTRDLWPAASVNAVVPAVKGQGKSIQAAAWLDANQHVEQMTWCPGLPMLIPDKIVVDGGWIDRPACSVFNLYRPPGVIGRAGSVDRWLGHARRLLAEHADHVINWLAHRVQHPQQKVNHALVLGGAPGIGKDTLLEPVKRAVGPWNFAEVSPQQLLGRFNGFLKSVILRVSEARDLGDQDRFALYDHLKVYLAAPPDVLRVDEKHLRETSVFNVVGVIITTNHKTDGIFLPSDDRRHFVAWSELTREDFDPDYWNQIYRWYEGGGFDYVTHYLDTLDISGFDPKAPPPKTPAFWEIVGASRAPEDDEMADALDALGRPLATTIAAIAIRASLGFAEWLRDRRNARRIPHRLEACGYVAVRNDASADGRWKVDRQNVVIYARNDLALRDRIQAAYRLSGAQ